MRAAWLLLVAGAAAPQDFTHRGFLEIPLIVYPRAARNDSSRFIAEYLLRWEASYKLSPEWRLSGALDGRADTHRQAERDWRVSWQDRERKRLATAIRRLSLTYSRGPLTVEVGKQLIRWGKTDILIPTDRFAPRDFLNVVNNDFLGVTAARLTCERGGNTLDLVWSPRFTPSRIPLFNQRWTVLPENVPPELELRDGGAHYPGGPQFGARWNRIASGFEYSLSFYEGYNHLPLFQATFDAPLRVSVERFYPTLRMYGGDAAVPLRWLTLKGEAAWFTTRTAEADEYVLYVIQIERQAGEWFFVGGYAGQKVTSSRGTLDFSPDRGLARTVLGRAGYTIDPNRSVAFEAAARQNGDGVWLKAEYSQAFGQNWRATAAFTLIRGAPSDFLGQYRRNSHASVTLRYSF